MIATIRRTLAGTAAAVCFAASFAANAGGVFYQSDFDPLGFAGTAKWYVDDNCGIGSLADNYYGVNLFAPGGCDVALAELTVSLWQGPDTTLTNAQNNNDPTLVTVQFDREMVSDSQPIANPVLVAGIWVVGGELAGVDTFLIGPKPITNITGTCNDSTDPVCDIDGAFGVQFTSGHNWLAPLAESPIGLIFPAIGNLLDPGAYLWEKKESYFRHCATPVTQFWWATFSCAREVGVNDEGYAPFDTRQYATGFKPLGRSINGDPTSVPEPGSLALLGGALVAGWVSRRRKRA